MTHTEGREVCATIDSRLAVLNTETKWMGVMRLLRHFGSSFPFTLGLTSAGSGLPATYTSVYQWLDESMCFFPIPNKGNHSTEPGEDQSAKTCSWGEFFEENSQLSVFTTDCSKKRTAVSPLCELHRPHHSSKSRPTMKTKTQTNIPLLECPDGHETHPFLACDIQAQCFATSNQQYGTNRHTWGIPSSSACTWKMTPLPPSFACQRGDQYVPYSLVCDYQQDCQDNSDEDFCQFALCPSLSTTQCRNKQCVVKDKVCDGTVHCFDRSDEETCQYLKFDLPDSETVFTLWRQIVEFVSLKQAMLVDHTVIQPGSHFACPGTRLLLSVYFLCNGVFDCPGHEDEYDCSDYVCPSYYRCRGSKVCMHARYMCDGIPQCPQFDDEVFCRLDCPSINCTCYGHAFTCSAPFPVRLYPQLRYLNAAGSGMTPDLFINNTLLIHLSLASCGLTTLEHLSLPNLRSLDVSNNLIEAISLSDLSKLGPHVSTLFLANNSLVLSVFSSGPNVSIDFPSLHTLDLSSLPLYEFDCYSLSSFSSLQHLNMSFSGINNVAHDFRFQRQLRTIDFRGCPMSHFPKSFVKNLEGLQFIWADTYRACCEHVLPLGFNLKNCYAPHDKLSTCHSLVGNLAYFYAMTVYAILTLLGNMVSFVFRVLLKKSGNLASYGVVVTHLSISDFISGLHQVIILTADRLYRGQYVWEDTTWRHSVGCQLAGVLSTLSRQVSTFFMVLLTLDRALALHSPEINTILSSSVMHLLCAMAWILGLLLAVVPWIPSTSLSASYSVLGICTLLPDTGDGLYLSSFYITAIDGVMHLTLFFLVGSGQCYMYVKSKINPYYFVNPNSQSAEIDIARRFIPICSINLLSRMVIGFVHLLSALGLHVSKDVHTGMILLLTPLPSLLNPYLYARSIAVGKQRVVCRQRVLQRLRARKKDRQF